MIPISIKGVVICDSQVLLLKNERDEWELPGGRLEPGETPEECLKREIAEEVQWDVTVNKVLNTWVYDIAQLHKEVFIVTYGCFPHTATPPVLSDEHREYGLFARHDYMKLNMPFGYIDAISIWYSAQRDWGV
jgi:8-oxo-dGTP pyrophosphatase MutT (NUDIX family)